MEECMICLEERESKQFIVFSCKHKTCTECFPLLLMYSSPCPICQQPIHLPNQENYNCSLCIGCTMLSMLLLYILSFLPH